MYNACINYAETFTTFVTLALNNGFVNGQTDSHILCGFFLSFARRISFRCQISGHSNIHPQAMILLKSSTKCMKYLILPSLATITISDYDYFLLCLQVPLKFSPMLIDSLGPIPQNLKRTRRLTKKLSKSNTVRLLAYYETQRTVRCM